MMDTKPMDVEPINEVHEEKTNLPYTHCLNCGAELQGTYCHECGQHAINATPKIRSFLLEYVNNAFIWDTKLLPTLWNLLRRPGFLTNEFMAGKMVSYEHPLKLNMFFLFVFITLFAIFSDSEKVNNTAHDLSTDERIFPTLALSSLSDDADYSEKMKQSPLDTIKIFALPKLATDNPLIITQIGQVANPDEAELKVWTAALPSVLIEDEVLLPDADGVYHFNVDSKVVDDMLQLSFFNDMWQKLVAILTNYFPMIVLFTVPFLSLAIALVYRKERKPHIHHLIFSLHYIALIELLMIAIYLLYLCFSPSYDLMKWILLIGSWLYLTVALFRVYKLNSWYKTIIKSFLICFTYYLICFLAFIIVFVIAIVASIDYAS